MIDRRLLKADITRDEGLRLKPYLDSVGKLSIGLGRNLDDKGISEAESDTLYDNDMDNVCKELDATFPWWLGLPEPVSRGLANMCYNLGLPRLKGFENMLSSLSRGEYLDAADHALDSKWARQVGARAERVAELYRSARR